MSNEMSEPQREMTLDEYVGVLGKCHRAVKELANLKSEVIRLEEAIKDTERFAWNVIKLDRECFGIEVEFARQWITKYGTKPFAEVKDD